MVVFCYFDSDKLIIIIVGRVLFVFRIKVYFKILVRLFIKLMMVKMFVIVGYKFGEGIEVLEKDRL